MTGDDVRDLFQRFGALHEGHFSLSSGLHSSGYLQSALILQYPSHAETLGRELARALVELEPTVVLSPALGGVVIGHEVGRALGVRALFAERQNGVLTLRRGFTLSASDRVVVVEDVVTTGGSTRETIEVARAEGGAVVGIGALVDRGDGHTRFDVPLRALMRMPLPTYAPDACPLCRQGLPILKPGSRAAAP